MLIKYDTKIIDKANKSKCDAMKANKPKSVYTMCSDEKLEFKKL